MSVVPQPIDRLLTIGEVRRELLACGHSRSDTAIRRAEARGIVAPRRANGSGLRLYTPADVEALKLAIRDREGPPTAA
jgi:DNA-binding transcriptional MerR regulator